MVLRRLFKKVRRDRRPRRQLLMERLTGRELFAVDPMGVITGSVFTDLANDGAINAIVDASGATVNDPTNNGVDVALYRDNNSDGAIDGGDTLVGTATTSGNGEFRFEGLTAGDYLLNQEAIDGLFAPTGPVAVTVTDDDGAEVTGIDNFSEAFQLLTVADSADPDASDSAGAGAAETIIGGERDLLLANNAGGDAAELEVDGELKFSSQVGVTATALVQYDGVDGDSALDASGLGGVDLTGAQDDAGILIGAFGDLAGGTLTVRVFTDATNASEATINIPVAAELEQFFVPFSDFATMGGAAGPADFTDVGAIEGFLDGVAGLDVRVSVISSVAPVEVTQNLANIESVSLGGSIFQDNDDDGAEDGDPGVTDVDVNLYRDDNANGTFDAATDTLVDSTTSGVGGAYLFENLTPGDYIVQIPSNEFSLGQPLYGYGTSLQTAAADPDDNVDGDDNGEEISGQGIVSQAVTLISQGEPTDDGDADPSSNLTVDFGVVPEIDLVVEKELTTADPVVGGEVDFQITVTNNGPLDATSAVLVDPLPNGLTFDRVENVPGGITTSVAGNQLTVDLGTVAVGAGNAITFNVVAVVDNAAPGATYTNAATVTADQRDTDPSSDSDSADVTTPSSDLRLTIQDDSDPVAAGDTLTYTLQVFNDGPDDATDIVVSDTLPDNVTFVSGTIDGSAANVSHTDGVVTANIAALASGASETIIIEVMLASDETGPLTNTATVSNTPNTDSDTTNNAATESTTVDREVDLAVSKSASANPIAGGTMVYTFTVSNDGPGDARGITVTDTLSGDLTFESFDAQTSGVTISQSGNELSFDVGTLAASESVTFSIDVLIGSDAAGELDNTATIATTDSDTNAANDSVTTTVAVGSEVDLTITKSDNVDNGTPGQAITYTLEATNSGPSDASGVQIVDTLPDNFTLTSVNASGIPFTNANGVVTFNVGDLASGHTATVTLTGTISADATGSLENEATVSSTESDSDATNNATSLTTTLAPQFDLSIEKATSGSSAVSGENLTYTINVDNDGPSDATNVVVTDVLPAGVTFVSGSIGGVAATVDGSTVTFDLGTVESGAGISGTLVVAVASTTTGTLTNQASISADDGDTDSTNDSDTVNTTLTSSVDLTVSKEVSSTTAEAGDQLTYTIIVSNAGPSAATGVTAVDTLPAGVTFVSGTGPDGQSLSANGRTVNVTIGTLDADATAEFTIVATIDANVTQDQTNSVTVATTATEANTNNNTDSVTTTIDRDDASISGFVYVDSDNDGVRDSGESPLAGIRLNLTGTTNQGQSVSRTTTTGADGAYSFTGLSAGTYRVQQVQPSSRQNGLLITDGKETVGQNATATVEDNGFSQIVLGANVEATGFNFGEVPLPDSARYIMSQNYSFLNQRSGNGAGSTGSANILSRSHSFLNQR